MQRIVCLLHVNTYKLKIIRLPWIKLQAERLLPATNNVSMTKKNAFVQDSKYRYSSAPIFKDSKYQSFLYNPIKKALSEFFLWELKNIPVLFALK